MSCFVGITGCLNEYNEVDEGINELVGLVCLNVVFALDLGDVIGSMKKLLFLLKLLLPLLRLNVRVFESVKLDVVCESEY